MSSIIKIRVNTQPLQNSTIVFNTTYGILEQFRYVRTSSKQSEIGSINNNQTLTNLRDAFNADYNNSGIYKVSITNISITEYELIIEHPIKDYFSPSTFFNPNSSFSVEFQNTATVVPLEITEVGYLPASVTLTETYSNRVIEDGGLIESIECIESTDFNSSNWEYYFNVIGDGGIVESLGCLPSDFTSESLSPRYLRLSVTTSEQVVSYKLGNNPSVGVSKNPFTIPGVPRETSQTITVKDSVGSTGFIRILTPDILVSSNVTSSFINSPSGATIKVFVSGIRLLTLQYSLDNIVFQSSNIFSGILEGNYTIYVRDQLGGVANISLTIPNFEEGGVAERFPYSDLPSKSNSIRFARYVNWGNCSDYKNDENTLSWQLPFTENACEYNQLFQGCDIITTQIKSNYKNIAVTVLDDNEGERDINVIKKSNYTELRDSREARVYNLGNLGVQTGMYFTSGSTYDYYTGEVTGTYSLNGNLPAWGVIGNYVFYKGDWIEISNIIYDNSKSAYVLVLDVIYTSFGESLTVRSLYDSETYDIYEFKVDMSDYSNSKIQVNITQTDDNVSFPDEVYLSEIIDVAEIQEGTLSIEYYNDNNTDIFYATGIKNKIRIPIEYFAGGYADNVESERTDSNTYLINSEGYENDLIAFKLMPKQMMRKVVQALSHKFVFLNDVQYVKEESPEIVSLIGSNLYRLNAQMTKSNAVYTARGKNETFSLGSFEVPSLLEIDTEGYLKIKN